MPPTPQWKMIKLKLYRYLTFRKRKPDCIDSNNVSGNKGPGLLPQNLPPKHIGSDSSPPPPITPSNKSSPEKSRPSQIIGTLKDVIHRPATSSKRKLLQEQEIQMLGSTDQQVISIRRNLQGARSSQPSVDAGKILAFSNHICKKMGLYLTRWKRSRRKNVSDAGGTEADGCSFCAVTTVVNIRRRQESSEDPGKIPIKNSSADRNSKNLKIGDSEVIQQGPYIELCKKKILMGEKCRPLTKSGMLHYDENGMLLPEET